ncbi:MAG TPA: DUF5668 domain-containing protein [Bryobacteraceae bacterium]|jgi:hypothetical protein|nr:DUF5668 domain-containing protein [Bryobacteraceae bacterium]
MLRAVRGPITLITVGLLLALNNFTEYRFEQTWPVILIVFGLMSLLGRSTERMAPPPPGYQQPFPPQGFQPPPGGYAQGSYSQSPYSQPAAGSTTSGPAKGGFGGSAAPNRTPDPNQTPNNPGGSL